MDTEYVHLHNGILLSCYKQWIHEILRQIEELENNILSEVNQSQKKNTWWALTDKWILAQKLSIPKVQSTDQMKLKKEDGYFSLS